MNHIKSDKKRIKELDKIATKTKLTEEEKGFIMGSFVRLETVAIKYGRDKYGISIYNLIIKFMGG